MKKTALVLILASLFCTTNIFADEYSPIVDRPNENFEKDFEECYVISAQNGVSETEMALRIAMIGESQREEARTQTREYIMRNCLKGRGHSVLN